MLTKAMMQYLVILLDDTAVSFCHYGNEKKERRPMPLDVLREGIRFGMKENLRIQFVYPDYGLPPAYADLVESIDHSKIMPASRAGEEADVVVMDGLDEARATALRRGVAYVLRLGREELLDGVDELGRMLAGADRLNVVLTDVEQFAAADFDRYARALAALSPAVEQLYASGQAPQLNLLTDHMMLSAMNNCGAGDTVLTLAPDGHFYPCPAFYQASGGYSVGTLADGPDVKNPQLYRLDHAPLCRRCDAYQCRRCVWLGRRLTREVNTPGHEQCVLAHLERNASRQLLADIRRHGTFLLGQEIKEIGYLDPFDARQEW